MDPPSRPTYLWEVVPAPEPASNPEPDYDPIALEAFASREIWRVTPCSTPPGGTLEPLSAEWFEHLEAKRYRRHGRWLAKLLEFDRHPRESLLAIGDGLGIDWVNYARAGASVSVLDPSSDRLRLYRHHFGVRKVQANYIQAPMSHWPLADDRTDVVAAVFNERPDVPWVEVMGEAFRVLRPGGKMLAVLPSHFNVNRWSEMLLPWRNLFRRRDRSDRFTGREMREHFEPFTDVRVWKRHLRRSEMPYLWRWMMLPVAERLMGRFLVIKAFKPLRASGIIRMAA